MKKKYLKENFEPIVLKSKNLTEILINLNMIKTGNSRTTLKKYIKKYNIDTSHFESISDKYQRTLGNISIKTPLTLILIENSTFTSTNHLKERLYNEGLKERKCELCGQDEIWNGNKMSLILDHKNGINNDHRIDNLRIVCPNCNATLPTHCRGANRMNKIIKKNIIKPTIKNNDSLINKSINARTVDRPSLDTLLFDVENLGYSATGRKYGVSDNAIRKWIKFYTKFNK